MRKLLIGLLTLGSITSFAQTHTCKNVNGGGVQELTLKFDKVKGVMNLEIPESVLGSQVRLESKYDANDFYGVSLFEDDGAVTYSVTIGSDVDSDFILLTTSGDVDTKTSFYRCPKSEIIID